MIVDAKKTSSLGASSGLVWTFLFGNFLIGSGVMLAPGLLLPVAQSFEVSAQQAALMISVAAVTIGIGSPLLATITSSIDRRLLLTGSLMVYAVGHLACALAPTLWSLILLRSVALLGAAVFTPQAAAALHLMLPPERRAAGITTIFLGWSIASVVGAPAGAWLGAHIGWRYTFAAFAALCLVGIVLVARVTPRGVKATPLSRTVWLEVFQHPTLVMVLLVTALYSSAQFTVFAYIAPYLAFMVNPLPETLSLTLLVFGVSGVLGNVWASRRISRHGAASNLNYSLAFMTVGLFAISFTQGSLLLFLCAGFIWGLGTFSSNSSQQARLAQTAPTLAGASIALNTGMIYFGQAVGTTLGGFLSAHLGFISLAGAGAAIAVISLLLSRQAARTAAASSSQ